MKTNPRSELLYFLLALAVLVFVFSHFVFAQDQTSCNEGEDAFTCLIRNIQARGSTDAGFIGAETILNSENQGACFFNDPALSGQLRARGTNGTVITSTEGILVNSPSSRTEAPFGNVIANSPIVNLTSQPGNSVAIIILDDFTKNTLDSLTHGDLVSEHFGELIKATGSYEEIPNDSKAADIKGAIATISISANSSIPSVGVTTFKHLDVSGDEPRLFLIKVDVSDIRSLDTILLKDRLKNFVTALNNVGIQNVVVNMSFVVIPCSRVDAFIQNQSLFQDFSIYILAITLAALNENNSIDVQAIIEGLDGNQPLDIILQELDTTTGLDVSGKYEELENLFFLSFNGSDSFPPEIETGSSISLVASAGNFGFRFPFYPGSTLNVIAVGASLGENNNGSAPFANCGEVLEVGGLYFSHSLQKFYSGTSFSAPVVSLANALALSLNMGIPFNPINFDPSDHLRPLAACPN